MSEKKFPPNAEVYQIVGVQPWEFVPDGSNESISGVTLHFLGERKGCFGLVPGKLKMSVEAFSDSLHENGLLSGKDIIGLEIGCFFNRYGKMTSFVI